EVAYRLPQDLVTIMGNGGNQTTAITKDYVIDYTSALKNVLMETETGGLTYRFTYGFEKLSAVVYGISSGAGSMQQTYEYPDGSANVVKLWYHHSRLGTTDFLTDNVQGKVTSYTAYDDWGALTMKTIIKLGTRELDLVTEYTVHRYDPVLGVYYARARMYDAGDRRFMAVDLVKGNVFQPPTLVRYTYALNNPKKYIDLDGLAPSFYKSHDEKWRFLMDSKGLNATISIFGVVPFLDSALWWTIDMISGTVTVSQSMIQNIATNLGAAAGAVSIIGGASKLAKLSSAISAIITGGNLVYELLSDSSYINQITHSIFSPYYPTFSCKTTVANFVAYAAITKDMIDKGIVVYSTSWGSVIDIKIDWDRYNRYFEDLGITTKQVADYVGLGQWDDIKPNK
ncbi:MAG: hypothetical protein FWG48_01950, partial [Oscillospiraceae bacterium]|nr:hypothetical protein [Oscillospiraceae bacterium]